MVQLYNAKTHKLCTVKADCQASFNRSHAVAVTGLFDRLLGAVVVAFVRPGGAHFEPDGGVVPLFEPAVARRLGVYVTFESTVRHRWFLPKTKRAIT